MRGRNTRLFSEYDLYAILTSQTEQINKTIDEVKSERILEEDLSELTSSLEASLKITSIVILESEITVQQSEAKVDVSQDFNRGISDRSRPFYIDGLKIAYFVPFTGDKTLFKCRPNQFTNNPPHAQMSGNELLFEYQITDGNVASTKNYFEQSLQTIRQWVGWVNSQVEAHNNELTNQIRQRLLERNQRLQESREQINTLGFRVRTVAPPPIAQSIPMPPPSKQARKRSIRKPSSPPEIYDVALSFAGEDREYVENVALLLQEAGINVFNDKFEEAELWGKNLIDHFAKIYAGGSQFVVMFVSKHYSAKAWTNHERRQAQAHAFKERNDFILPARFDDTEIPGLPATVAYIDLRSVLPGKFAELIIAKLRT